MGTDGEGMEETDGGVLDLVAVHCCLLMVHQCRRALLSPHCRVSWPCCCHAVLLSLCRIVVVGSLWSCPVSQRGGLGGRWDRGYLHSINNDKQHPSFVVLVATLLSVTWHLHSPLAAGSRFHPWVAVFTYGQSFAFVASHFHLWLSFSYVCVHGQSFTFVASHLHS